MRDHLYRPGDVILATRGKGYRLVVLDPPRTSRGKLRLQREPGGAIRTAWWGLHGDPWLPEGYELER